jgi:hypothetical protein
MSLQPCCCQIISSSADFVVVTYGIAMCGPVDFSLTYCKETVVRAYYLPTMSDQDGQNLVDS